MRKKGVVCVQFGGRFFGLPLEGVERVLPALSYTPVLESEKPLLGYGRIEGEYLPIFSQAPEAPLDPSQALLLVSLRGERACLLVEKVVGLFFQELPLTPSRQRAEKTQEVLEFQGKPLLLLTSPEELLAPPPLSPLENSPMQRFPP